MPDEHRFCHEHSEVMRCLGALEEGQKNMASDIGEIKTHIGAIARSVSNGKVTTAIEKTKSGILYAVILIVGAGGVAALFRYLIQYL